MISVTTPLLLLELLLATGLPLSDILFTIFMDVRASAQA
jgi:bacteriorhodopsin